MAKSDSNPPSLVWGVATSSYQIEGAAFEDGRSPSIWDTFCRIPGKVLNGDTGDVACDHYHRWQDDLDLIKGLGVDAYRFSVAWPRVMPGGVGAVNEAGLDFYESLVDGLLARGLQPYCTLYHWDLPQVLEDAGGWVNRDTAFAFAEYADALSGRLGDRVVSYATLNEPWCSAYLGYANGHHAPGYKDLKMSLQATHHLLLAHGLALPVLRQNTPGAEHGIVLNLKQIYPESESPEDRAAAERFDGFHNLLYLEPLFRGRYPQGLWDDLSGYAPVIKEGDLDIMSAPLDFLGVNYYTPEFVEHAPEGEWPNARSVEHPEAEKTAMGWEVYPQGLTDLLLRVNKDYGVPLYVTENGAAYPDPDKLAGDELRDEARVDYYQRHLKAVQNALEQGVDVRGYFAWSLLDNFEWAFGYEKRFGIVHVDFETQQRTLKDSAKWYRGFVSEQRRSAVSAD